MLSVELVPIRVPSLAPGRIDQHQPNWPHSYQETTAARHQKKERRVWEGAALRKESLDNTFDIGFGQGIIQTKWGEKWDGRARQNYLNKLEGNRKRLINPIGPAGEDWIAQKYDQIIFNKSTKNCLRGAHDGGGVGDWGLDRSFYHDDIISSSAWLASQKKIVEEFLAHARWPT